MGVVRMHFIHTSAEQCKWFAENGSGGGAGADEVRKRRLRTGAVVELRQLSRSQMIGVMLLYG